MSPLSPFCLPGMYVLLGCLWLVLIIKGRLSRPGGETSLKTILLIPRLPWWLSW